MHEIFNEPKGAKDIIIMLIWVLGYHSSSIRQNLLYGLVCKESKMRSHF